MSYEIINVGSDENIKVKLTNKKVKEIESRLGLGGLIKKFKDVYSCEDLCKKLKEATKTRNQLAHRAAAEYLEIPISTNGAFTMNVLAKDFKKSGDDAYQLYLELIDIYNKIDDEHGRVV